MSQRRMVRAGTEMAEADTDRQCGRQRGATVSRDKTRVSVRSRISRVRYRKFCCWGTQHDNVKQNEGLATWT